HFTPEFEDRPPSRKRFTESVAIGTPMWLMAVIADTVVSPELGHADCPGDLWKATSQFLKQVHALLMGRRSLWHPCPEDRLQGVGRLVDPVVVDFDLRESSQNESGTRQRFRIPRKALQRPEQAGAAWAPSEHPGTRRTKKTQHRRRIGLEIALDDG